MGRKLVAILILLPMLILSANANAENVVIHTLTLKLTNVVSIYSCSSTRVYVTFQAEDLSDSAIAGYTIIVHPVLYLDSTDLGSDQFSRLLALVQDRLVSGKQVSYIGITDNSADGSGYSTTPNPCAVTLFSSVDKGLNYMNGTIDDQVYAYNAGQYTNLELTALSTQ